MGHGMKGGNKQRKKPRDKKKRVLIMFSGKSIQRFLGGTA
jgi:hypothetical protein